MEESIQELDTLYDTWEQLSQEDWSFFSFLSTNFTYNYGSYNGGYYEYNIKNKNKKNIFTAKGYNGVNLNINKEIDEYYLEQLSKIIKETNIESWNGFNKKDNKILDGYSFNLKVEYKNGKTINASGYMKYPKNYKNTHKKIVKFLKSIK